MSYFQSFPVINYSIRDQSVLMQDLTIRTKFFRKLPQSAFTSYYIRDLDTPDLLSYKFYGDPKYYWMIMLANEMFSIEKDWPLSETQLYYFLEKEYGLETLPTPHHWVNDQGLVVNEDDPTALGKKPVSYMDHYTSINEAKKIIRVPKAEIVREVATQHNKLVTR